MTSIRTLVRALIPAVMTAGIVAVGAAPASAATIPGCTTAANPVIICFTEDAPILGPVHVSNVALDSVNVGHIVGYLDDYAYDYGLGVAHFSCVSLIVNGNVQDPCGSLFGTPTNRVPLFDTPVDAYTPRPSDSFVDLYVCRAELDVTVDGRGITDQQVVTLCANF